MRSKTFALLAVFFVLVVLPGCGSNRDSGGDQTVGQTTDQVLAAATFVGSTQCLSCHANKQNWGHTLHKAVLRAPNAFSAAQAKTETFYAGTVNKGLLLSLGTADGGLDDAVTPDGEFIAYYNDGSSWKTHYELGLGATATMGALPLASGTFDLKYAAQIILSDSEYFVQFTNLAVPGTTARYKILFSYGGERNYKQRYVLVDDNNNQGNPLGASKHISPLQYNDKWSGYDDPTTVADESATGDDLNFKWVNYHGERWYDTGSDELATAASKDAFDGNCAGCHFTGYSLTKNAGGEELADAVDDPNGAVDFDGNGSLDEINIGCEACHGAGSAHASSQNPAYIVNPGDLSPADANMVCGQCHIRGKSIDKFTEFAEAPAQAPFPAKLDADGNLMKFRPGLDDLSTFYSFDSGDGSGAGNFASQYWGGEPSGGDFQASVQHHQQYIDILQGPHAPDKSYDPTCFSCHDSHDNADPGRHQIVTSVTEDNIVVKAANDDNTLCLACHAGHGPFADLTVEEVAGVNANSAFNVEMAGVKEAVTDHTQHYYDPENDDVTSGGSSRCSKCHLPKAAKSALKYDIHAHTFEIIEPDDTLATEATATEPRSGVPNACSACHEVDTDAELADLQAAFDAKFAETPTNLIFDQWASSGHADYAGEPFNHWNEDGEVSASCAKCHSKDGFIDFAADGTVDAAARLGTVVSCGVCHIEGDSPDLYTDASTRYDDLVTNPALADVEFPATEFSMGPVTADLGDASNICMSCHQGRESGLTVVNASPNDTVQDPDYDSFNFINRHYFAAAGILFGTDVTAGFEYAGKIYKGQNTYAGHVATGFDQLDTCSGCHMREGAANHTFEPDITRCGACHVDSGTVFPGTLTSFENLGLPFGTGAVDYDVDYDGDGVGESFQAEIDGLEAVLLTAIEGYAANTLNSPISYTGVWPYWAKAAGGTYRDFDRTLLQAAYNYHSNQDPCGDMHNYKYVIQTIIDSIEDLGGDISSFTRP